MNIIKIAVFDSGLGGITVLKKLIESYRNNEYIYYADLKNMPYGSKSYDELKLIAKNILDKLNKYDIDLYICACGTLSSVALQYMREYVNKPVVGIIDPISNNINSSHNILILSTVASHKCGVFKKIIKAKNVYSKGCEEFVELIENDLDNKQEIVNKYILEYINKIDTIVCGCTHYELLSKYYINTLGNINIITAGDSIVKYIKEYINDSKYSLKVITSKESEIFNIKYKEILKNMV